MSGARHGGVPGGQPPQSALTTARAVFTTSYAVIPRAVMRDIVCSYLPHWQGFRCWVLARPLSGFAETFSHCLCELQAGGGSERPEHDARAQAVLYVAAGELQLQLGAERHVLRAGGYAFLPAGSDWQLHNRGADTARFHWIRKAWQAVEGLAPPPSLVTDEAGVAAQAMPGTEGRWATKRFVDPADLRYDFHVNIVEFCPGASIPFAETHVMEHGIFVLEGKAVYQLNTDWHEVAAGDFLWLRAFCPQACVAAGPGAFRYLLYKDVNRQMPLRAPVGEAVGAP